MNHRHYRRTLADSFSKCLKKALSPEDLASQGYKFKQVDRKHYSAILIFHGKKRIGHLGYEKNPVAADSHNPERVGYHRVYVGHLEPEHRGKGLYQHAIELASQHVKSLGSKGVVSEGYQRSGDATRAWDRVATHVSPFTSNARIRGKLSPGTSDYFKSSEMEKGAKPNFGKSLSNAIWKSLQESNKIKKAKEEKRLDPQNRRAFRQARQEFEAPDKLQQQLTTQPGVSRRGIEVRRADPRIKGAVSHGYTRVGEPEFHRKRAKQMFGKNMKKQMKLEHYSPREGLKQIDPEHVGTGVDWSARSRESIHPRSFFYLAGTSPEPVVSSKAKSKYTIELGSGHPVYDLGTDPAGIITKLHKEAQKRQINPGVIDKDEMHGAIKAAGYHGYYNSRHDRLPNVVALYHPVKVTNEESINKTLTASELTKAPIENLDTSIGREEPEVPSKERYENKVRSNEVAPGIYHHAIFSKRNQEALHMLSNHPDPFAKDATVYSQLLGDTDKFVGAPLIVQLSQVHPGHKGKGYGKALYEFALAHHGSLHSDELLSPTAQDVYRHLQGKGVKVRFGKPDTRERHTAETELGFKPSLPKLAANEELDSEIEKGNFARRAAAVAGIFGALSQPVSAESTQRAPAAIEQVQHSVHKPTALRAIAAVESSGGIDTKHAPLGGMHAGERAFGKYGLTPIVIRETIKKHPDLSKQHSSALNLKGQEFSNYMSKNPGLEDTVASRHYDRLKRHFGHDLSKIGFAWLNGISGTMRAEQKGFDFDNHWHVKKVRQAYENIGNKVKK